MGIKINDTNISNLKLGTDDINKVYQGTELVWQRTSPVLPGNNITWNGTNYRLIDNIDPNVFCGSGFINLPLYDGGSLSLSIQERLQITDIQFKTLDYSITSLGDCFLTNCKNLPSIDLSLFTKIESIGSSFLSVAEKLTSLDVSGLQSVKTIGVDFLYGCTNLGSVDLKPMVNVTYIGNAFMNYCKSIVSINFSQMTKLEHIGFMFLYACDNLIEINMNNISPSIIDMNYDYMTFAVYTSSSTEPTCPAYKIGINILGNYQEQYKTSFPGQKVAEGSFYYWRRWR